MSARDTYGVIEKRGDEPQHLAALYHLGAARAGSHKLGVIGQDSGGVYYKVCALDIFRALTHVHLYTHIAHRLKRFSFVIIRAGYKVALRMKYLGEGVHTRTAYTYKMQMFFRFQLV